MPPVDTSATCRRRHKRRTLGAGYEEQIGDLLCMGRPGFRRALKQHNQLLRNCLGDAPPHSRRGRGGRARPVSRRRGRGGEATAAGQSGGGLLALHGRSGNGVDRAEDLLVGDGTCSRELLVRGGRCGLRLLFLCFAGTRQPAVLKYALVLVVACPVALRPDAWTCADSGQGWQHSKVE